MQGVHELLAGAALHKGDAPPVGAPGGPAAVARRAFGHVGGEQRPGRGPGLGIDEVQVEVVVAVGVGPALAGKHQLLAVGTPGGQVFIVRAGRQVGELARGQVEQVQVLALLVQVAVDILLELEAVEDDGRRGFLFGFLGGRERVGVGVADDEGQALAVGRPHVVGHAALELGHLLGFAAGPVQQPELGVAAVLLAAARHEAQELAVGAEAGLGLAGRSGGHAQVLGAVGAGHPHVGVALVGGRIGARHGVGHPGPVGRKLGVGHVAQPRQVAELEGPGRGLRPQGRQGQYQGSQ